MMNNDQNANGSAPTAKEGKGAAGGIAGLVLLALAGLARHCDDIGRVAVRHVDEIAPSYADDLGKLSTQADDVARATGQRIDELAYSQGESVKEEANAAASLSKEGSSPIREDLQEAAKEVGKTAAQEALKAENDRGKDDGHQH